MSKSYDLLVRITSCYKDGTCKKGDKWRLRADGLRGAKMQRPDTLELLFLKDEIEYSKNEFYEFKDFIFNSCVMALEVKPGTKALDRITISPDWAWDLTNRFIADARTKG